MSKINTYYIKENEEVKQVSKEEYDDFNKQAKKDGKKYLCSNCKICNCDKIKYSDINHAQEVTDGSYLFSKIIQTKEGQRTKTTEYDFYVYGCKRFTKMKEIVLRESKEKMHQILEIDKLLNELKSSTLTPQLKIKIDLLEQKRKMLYESIESDSIKQDLDNQENLLKLS